MLLFAKVPEDQAQADLSDERADVGCDNGPLINDIKEIIFREKSRDCSTNADHDGGHKVETERPGMKQ
jgi:hypothetical protein